MSATPITASATIQEWLDHPTGGPALRGFLEKSGSDVEQLAPAYGLPLAKLVDLSGGAMTKELIDGIVAEANGGVIPEEEAPAARGGGDRFEGKTVIVTGAAGGIGKATAQRLLSEGARVIATDIAAERLEALGGDGEKLTKVAADLSDAAAVEKIIAAAGEKIDGLANVAGINDDFSAIHEVSDEMWAKVFSVNIDGLVRLTRAVTQKMLEAGSGSVVHVASEAALRGSASGVAYTASKHAVIGITRSMAFMYAKSGIRTNVVAPGGVATGIPMAQTLGEFGNARLEEARVNIPGLSTAEDQAASILWLLSDDAGSVNGAILANDGGWSAV